MTDPGRRKVWLRGVAGALVNERIEVLDGLRIGTAPACDVALPEQQPACQARFRVQNGRTVIESLAGDGLYVNGRGVREQVLAPGDELRIGAHRFVVKMPGLRPESVLRDIPERPRHAAARRWLAAIVMLAAALLATWYYLLR